MQQEGQLTMLRSKAEIAAANAVEWAATEAVVTVAISEQAKRLGGVMQANADTIYDLDKGGAPPWPASRAEMQFSILPRLASRSGNRGLTVRQVRSGSAATGLWEARYQQTNNSAGRAA